MYNPKHHRQTKKASKDNKPARLSPSLSPLPPHLAHLSHPSHKGASRERGEITGETIEGEEIDLGKVLQESWDLERTPDDEFLLKNIAFPTPRRQLEQLEYQSNQLNEINTRVSSLLHNFEEQYHKDDAFNLIEENEEAKFFDKKSLLEESKGKVKVLVVDYNKLSLTRDAVLTSLREWFDVVNNDDISDNENDEERAVGTDNSFASLVKGVNRTKDKLSEVHTQLVDYCNEQIKNSTLHEQQEEARKAEVELLQETVERLNLQIDELNGKIRDSDLRNLALQKTLERTQEELKFFRLSDSSKTGQLKDELFQTQQKSKDREMELSLELEKTQKKLAKTQDQLDQFVLSLHQEQQNTHAAIEELGQAHGELKVLKKIHDSILLEAEERESELAEKAEVQDAEKDQELLSVRKRAQEEIMVKMYKMKNEHEENIRKILDENASVIHRLEAQNQEKLEKQTQLFAESMKSKDSKNALDAIKSSYEEKMKKLTEQNFADKEKAKKDHARQLAETVKEYQIKLNYQSQQLANQKSALEHNDQVKKDIGSLGSSTMLSEEANKKIADITETYEQQINQARIQVRDREDIIVQLKNQLAMVTGILEKTRTAPSPLSIPSSGTPSAVSTPLSSAFSDKSRISSSKKPPSRLGTPAALDKPRSGALSPGKKDKEKEKPKVIIPKSPGGQTSVETPLKAKKPVSEEVKSKLTTSAKKEDNALESPTRDTRIDITVPAGEETEETQELESEEAESQGDDDVTSLLLRLEKERLAMDKKLDTMKEKEEQLTQRLEKQRSQILQPDRLLSSKSDNLQVTPKAANLLTPGTTDLQKLTRHLPEARLRTPDKAQRTEDTQPVADANVDGYLLDMRSEVTNLTKENDALRTQLANLLEKYSLPAPSAPAAQPDIQENPLFVALEERLSALIVENELLRKGEQIPTTTVFTDEPGSAVGTEIILKAREAKLTQAMQEVLDANAKVTMLEDQLANYEKAMQEGEGKRVEMEGVISNLTQQVNKAPSLSSQAEQQLRSELEKSMAQERNLLNQQILQLEKQIQEDAAAASSGTAELRLVFRQEMEHMISQQDEVLQAITENNEKRVKGLTEALTACLSDTDIAEELRKDAEYKVLSIKLMQQKETSRLQEEIKRMESEHAAELQSVEKKDRQELQRLRNTLERLRLEFETFLNEDNYTMEHAKSNLIRTGSTIRGPKSPTTALYVEQPFLSSLQTGIVGTKYKEMNVGQMSFASQQERSNSPEPNLSASRSLSRSSNRSPPPRRAEGSPSLTSSRGSEMVERRASENQELIINNYANYTNNNHNSHNNHNNYGSNNNNNFNTNNFHSVSSTEDILTAPETLQGLGKAIFSNSFMPPDYRSLARSMESATNDEISAAVSMYQGFKTMVARRKYLQDQKVQEKFVEFQQLTHENSSLKKALASAKGRIAELERQLLALKNQTLENRYRSEMGVSEYKAIISHQELVIEDLRYMYRRNQGALMATQERKGRLEKSLLNLHTSLSDHERTIASQLQTIEEMRVQIDDMKRSQHRGGYNTDETGGPLRIRSMLPGTRPGTGTRDRFFKSLLGNDSLQSEPTGKDDREKLEMMEQVLKQMDANGMDEEIKSARESTLALLEKDKQIRKLKIGAIFHKLHQKFQLKLIQAEIKKNPDDRLALALKKMEERHTNSLARWESRRQELIEQRKLHLLQVMRAFSTIIQTPNTSSDTIANITASNNLQLNSAPIRHTKLPEMTRKKEHLRQSQQQQQQQTQEIQTNIDYTSLFPPRNLSPSPIITAGSTGNSSHSCTVASNRSKLRKQALPREPEIDMILQAGQANVVVQGTQVVLGRKKEKEKERPESSVKFYFNDRTEKNSSSDESLLNLTDNSLPAVKRVTIATSVEIPKQEKVVLPPINQNSDVQ